MTCSLNTRWLSSSFIPLSGSAISSATAPRAAASSWVSVEHRDSCRSSPAPGATSARHEVSRSLKMKSEARRILLYSVLRYSSTARVKLRGVPAVRVLGCICAGNTRYSCTSSSSAAAVSSHSAASLARHSAQGWLASTAQYEYLLLGHLYFISGTFEVHKSEII